MVRFKPFPFRHLHPVSPCSDPRYFDVALPPSIPSEKTREEKFLSRFQPPYSGIAVVLGKASNGLCSIDCDSEAALDEFLRQNPGLKNTLISKTNRWANLWVRISGDYP